MPGVSGRPSPTLVAPLARMGYGEPTPVQAASIPLVLTGTDLLARAQTGTVLASFLLHLGYNSMIALATIIGTHGFTKIPTH